MKKNLWLSWLVMLLVPFAVTFLGLRLLLTPVFPLVEYNLPGFPTDSYGFTQEERLDWSRICIQYLLNDAEPSFLGDLVFSDGSPLFNPDEVDHMQDVKQVIQPVMWIGYGTWGLLLILGISSMIGNWLAVFLTGLWRGGWLTAGLVVGIGLFAVISFWQFFSVFHSLFFESGSWQFLYSDTLIRLFPLRFWQDAFLFVGLLDIVIGLALGFLMRPRRKLGVIQMI
jgi:integral membrane protein (TIGR01906 family)